MDPADLGKAQFILRDLGWDHTVYYNDLWDGTTTFEIADTDQDVFGQTFGRWDRCEANVLDSGLF